MLGKVGRSGQEAFLEIHVQRMLLLTSVEEIPVTADRRTSVAGGNVFHARVNVRSRTNRHAARRVSDYPRSLPRDFLARRIYVRLIHGGARRRGVVTWRGIAPRFRPAASQGISGR